VSAARQHATTAIATVAGSSKSHTHIVDFALVIGIDYGSHRDNEARAF
jgi:phosphoenolpyruvate synthase/pyruvate phosphate dikinase